MNGKRLTFILYFIFLSQLLVDAANGFFQEILNYHSLFPAIYKTLLFIFLLYFIRWNNIAGKFFIFLATLSIIPFFFWMISGDLLSMKQEIAALIKILYPYLLLNFILRFQSFISAEKLLKILCLYGILAGIIILFSYFLEIKGASALIYGYGTKGIFRAGNDIGLIIFISLLLVLYLGIKGKKLSCFFCAGILVFSLFNLGTMTGLLVTAFACGICLFMLIFYKFKFLHIPVSYRLFLLACMLTFTFFAIHQVSFVINYNDYMKNKCKSFLSGRSRGELPNLSAELFQQGTAVQKLFGYSNYKFQRELYDLAYTEERIYLNANSDVRTPELDFHEMILSYGIIYGTCLLIFPIFLTLKAMLFFLRDKTFLAFIIAMISSVLLLHSLLAGHVLFVFTVCGLWFPLYGNLSNTTKFTEADLKKCES